MREAHPAECVEKETGRVGFDVVWGEGLGHGKARGLVQQQGQVLIALQSPVERTVEAKLNLRTPTHRNILNNNVKGLMNMHEQKN